MFDPVNPYEQAPSSACLDVGTDPADDMASAQTRLTAIVQHDRVFRMALRIVRNHEDATDAVQSAFAKLWPMADSLADVEKSVTTAVRRCAIDIVRRRKPVSPVEQLEDQQTINPDLVPSSLAWVLEGARPWELACVAAYLQHGSSEACETYTEGAMLSSTVRKALSNIRARVTGKAQAMREADARLMTKGTLVGHGWASCKWLGVVTAMALPHVPTAFDLVGARRSAWTWSERMGEWV